MSDVARITGRVRQTSGGPVSGCRVQARAGAPGPSGVPVVAEAWTSTRGEFVLAVPQGRNVPAESEPARIRLEVTDGTGAEIGAEELLVRPGQPVHANLTAGRKAGVVLPVALPLVRAPEAPVVRPEALAVIEAALALLAPPGSPAWEGWARAARRPLPPARHVEELLELAWATLDGDPRAAHELHGVLSAHADVQRRDPPRTGNTPPVEDEDRRRVKGAYGVPREAAPRGPTLEPATATGRLLAAKPRPEEPEDRKRDEADAAVPAERLLPILAATVRVARTADERTAFLDGLHEVLAGLSAVERLHRAALDALQHRRLATLRTLLGRVPDDDGRSDAPSPPRSVEVRTTGSADPWWERLQGALREILAVQRGRAEGGYRITAVEPPHAQPGEAVRLVGEGFGIGGGQVVFDGAAPVEPQGWSDTEVRAVVPEGARPGLVTLRVLDGVVRVRRRMIELFREGAGIPFEGGRPVVTSVLVDGRPDGAWVRPGARIAVSWTTASGRKGKVALRARIRPASPGGGTVRDVVLADESDLPASGGRILVVPEVAAEHVLLIRVEARTAGGQAAQEASFPVAVPPRLRIEGVEVTQGVQRAPWDPSPALPTVAGRDTLVRVYVSADRGGFHDDLTRVVRAHLRLDDLELPPWPVADPTDPGFVAGRVSAIDRARARDSLLFRIPAPLCRGTRELRVEVVAEGSPVPSTAEARVTWTWWPTLPLPVRLVRLARPDRPAPGPADVLATAARALDLLPTSLEDVAPAWLDVVTTDAEAEHVVDALAEARDPAAWEWLAHEVVGLPRDEAEALWLIVGDDAPRTVVDVRRKVALAAVAPDPVSAPHRRAAAAGGLARLADPAFDAGDEGGRRIADVPFDPHLHDTVVGRARGVRDVGASAPAEADAWWTSPARWRRLVERG